jgi:hypothetical protein
LFAIVSPAIKAHLKLLSGLAFALRDPEFASVINRRGMRDEVFASAKRIDELVPPVNTIRLLDNVFFWPVLSFM